MLEKIRPGRILNSIDQLGKFQVIITFFKFNGNKSKNNQFSMIEKCVNYLLFSLFQFSPAEKIEIIKIKKEEYFI